MPDSPPPETLDWLRQCAAAPGARWHRALLAEVEGQTPPEIEPIPAEGLAWLQQSARVHGATYSQVLLHVLERIELLDKDSTEQFQSNRFTFEAIVRRLERLEATQQHDTLLIGGPAQPATHAPHADCPACEGSPSVPNSPCHVCGLSQPTPPEPVTPVSDSKMAAYNHRAAARFAELDRLEKAIDFNSCGWELTSEGERWKRLMAEQGQDEYEMGL